MKGRFCCFVIIALQMVTWTSATSRPFPLNASVGAHKQGPDQSSESLTFTLAIVEGVKGANAKMNEEAKYEGVNNIGSRPPSCEHKCYGCVPCEAIQVPTTSSRHRNVGTQYANYEPEGWKCKCGPSFYSP